MAHPAAHLHLTRRAMARSVRAWATYNESMPSLPGSHPSRRLHGASRHPKQALTWSELHRASQLAKWAGLTYVPAADLPELVQAHGLQLMAHGRTNYTSWYVAEGHVNHQHLHAAACRQVNVVAAPARQPQHTGQSSSTAAGTPTQDQSRHAHSHQPPKPQKCRFVFIRGVHWNAPDSHMPTITSALMNVWPAPFPPVANPSDKSNNSCIVSHTGISLLAADLYQQLLPWLSSSAPAPELTANTAADGAATAHTDNTPVPICIAGHSLGGALGSLVLARCVLEGHRHPSHITCHAFGSPPVLAHKDGGGGHRVLEVLGLPDTALQSFVLEHDPVPRAMLTTDPIFNSLKQYAPVRGLLEARSWLVGAQQGATDLAAGLLKLISPPRDSSLPPQPPPVVPALSAYRFLFENVGQVYMIKGGADVVPLGSAAHVDEILNMAVMDFLTQPARALQAWLDHHHTSYAYDLEAAALAALKKQLRATAKH